MGVTALPAISNQLPVGSLDSYIQNANSIPLLSKEREYELANRLLEKNDLKAAQELIMAHLRYVVRVAKGYMGYGLNLGDLIQEGTIGLMKAVKKFRPDREVRLVTFAMHWIKAEIHEFVIRNWRIVKIATTKAQRKLFFKLRSSKKNLGWLSQEEIEQIAKDLNVKPKDVVHMEKRLSSNDTSFELPKDEDGDSPYFAPAEYLEDHSSNPEFIVEKQGMQEKVQIEFQLAFEKLDARAQYILSKRWLQQDGKKATLEELAQKFSVSKERIRQIEAQAMKQMRLQLGDVA